MNIIEENKKQIRTMRKNFRLLREEREWSFEKLSQVSGIDAEILAGIENGEEFDVDFLIKLCKIYHITPHKIFLPLD